MIDRPSAGAGAGAGDGQRALLDESWLRAWRHLGADAPAGLQARLVAAWSEPQRHYHTLQHLTECLAHVDAALALARAPGEVEIALWFHDVVYDPKAKDNERRSADWAARELAAAGVAPASVARVVALVMATCHDAQPVDADQRLLVDIDLAILGTSPERFAEYDEQIRAEYAWVPGFVYRFKRRQVLRGFLERVPLFQTAHFRERLETPARLNLAAATR
ncbi:MAG: HD domain-containing protein [Silanimonas sp.]